MWSNLPLFPPAASKMAHQVDYLYFFLVGTTAFFTLLIVAMVGFFSWRYRRKKNPVATQIEGSNALEMTWTLIPTVIAMFIFVWGAALYFSETRPPRNAMEVYAVGKQWMWKFQHQEGQREINVLHVPVDRDVRMIMTSQDVIHSFFVPAFRIKADVLPGRYTSTWFHATVPGTYHLFCSQYCGTQHSGMVGEVVVMEPAAYQQWAASGSDGSLASEGEKAFMQYGCSMCHRADYQGRGPNLVGLFGKPVLLDDGRTVVADESYLRESIVYPGAKIVSGFKNIMPNFLGQISEEELISLVAYIKGLGMGQSNPPATVAEPTAVYPVAPQPEKSQATPSGK
ncbi:MAG: cytochrome c oxidase subunit II [Candidatus Korobacteraceae bacterium]|jgi:cytochrome c oxidase subunit 2